MLYVFVIPALLDVILFRYVPMYGVQIAFRNYKVRAGIWGSQWVGLEYFYDFIASPMFGKLMRNTLLLSLYQLVFGFPMPILLAFMMNEMRAQGSKRFVQMATYAPHFISMVAVVGLLQLFLQRDTGLLNILRERMGMGKLSFLSEPGAFRAVYINKLWTEGLLDSDMFTQTYTQVTSRILDDRVGMAGMDASGVAYPSDFSTYESLYALTADADADPVFPGPKAVSFPGRFVISADVDEETAATLLNFLDAAETLESYKLYRYGPEQGDELDYFGNGLFYNAEKDSFDRVYPEDATDEWNYRINWLTFWNFPGYTGNSNIRKEIEFAKTYPDTTYGILYKDGYRMLKWFQESAERQCAYAVNPLPEFFMSEEDLDRVSDLEIPLQDYAATMEAKFITGAEPLENFEAFREALRSLNVEEYIGVYQGYWDAYQAGMAG